MQPTEIISLLEQELGDKIKESVTEAIDPHAIVEPENLIELCTLLRDHVSLKFDMLNCISGIDYLEPDPKKVEKAGFDPHTEVVYHMSSFTHKHRFTVKIILPRWKDDQEGELPEVPSVASIWLAADWHEREVYDLSGVWFTDHPSLTRILLAEDWEGHPLRKDYEFPLEYHGIRGR